MWIYIVRYKNMRRLLSDKIIIWLLIMPLLIMSCQQQAPKVTEVIDIINKEAPVKIDIYDIVDSISYIQLETSAQCLLNDIRCAKRDGNFYFVKDRNGLFVFDGQGHFLNEIGQKGAGPNEYLYMDNFYLDHEHKLVCIISNVQKKILRYAYCGDYHSTLKIKEEDANIQSMMPCAYGKLLGYFPLPNDAFNSKSEYSLFELKDDLLVSERLLDAKKVKTGKAYYPFLYYPMALFDNRCFFISVFSNELYSYDGSENLAIYDIDIPDNIPDESFLEKHRDLDFLQLTELMSEKGIGLGITALEATSDYLFASVSNKSTMIWDKKQGILVARIYNPDLNVYSDLLSGGVSDEHLGFLTADFSSEMNEEDNPILYQYSFKKNIVEILAEKYKNGALSDIVSPQMMKK